MKNRNLSPDIVSLIHHVELNESGWWKKATGQVLKGVLWKAKAPQALDEIKSCLSRDVGIHLADDVIQRQLEVLISQNSVMRVPGSESYKLTEFSRKSLTEAHHQALTEQDGCKALFFASCAEYCPDLSKEDVWQEFIKALLHSVRVAGANLYHLLAGGDLEREKDWLSSFLRRFPDDHVDGLKRIVAAFFSPSNDICRRQVLRLLTAHFFAEASQLRPETLEALEKVKKMRTAKVVLDTNFIFSVLGLHDNPADDSVVSLIDIAQRNERYIKLNFYALPGTIDEAVAALVNQLHLVERVRTTAAMASAALSQPLPSIAKKFFDAAKRSPGLSAESFFRPYIDDLRTILRDKGIHVLDVNQTVYSQRQDVIDDVLSEQKRENTELKESRRKGYDRLLHDAALWHVINDRRSGKSESPFEVEYWAVSIDWRLIAFDKRKRSEAASQVPAVLYPSSLVQLLQFWIPRSEALDEGLVDSLRLPLFFQSFDPEDERATVKVLEALSRFENISDLPERTLRVVLANKALRGRLREADASNDEVFNLVREELLAEHKNALSIINEAKGTLATLEASLADERASREASERVLAENSALLDDKEKMLLEARKHAEEATALAKRVEAEANKKIDQQSRAILDAENAILIQQRQIFSFLFFALPIAIGFVFAYWAHPYLVRLVGDTERVWGAWIMTVAIGVLPLTFSCAVVSLYLVHHPELESWWLAKLLSVGKKALVAPALLALSSVFQGSVWDGVKAIFRL